MTFRDGCRGVVNPLARWRDWLVMVRGLWCFVRARDALADLDQEALIRGELKLRK
ncbi:MAG: hypothetical protein WC072_09470 [Methanoregulaceae archaeon]|jgi:hypothetical protein